MRAHDVYQTNDASAPSGAMVVIHKGVYDPKADYAKLTAFKAATILLGTVDATIPVIDGPCTPVASATRPGIGIAAAQRPCRMPSINVSAT